MTAAHGRTLRVDAARNYERILAAAGQAFEEDGPGVPLEEVARRAGVGVATVYRRFRNRGQLVRAVLEHIITAEIEPATAVETDDPWQDLAGTLGAAVDALAGRRVVLALAHEADIMGLESVQRCIRSMERLLRRAVDAGLVRPELQARDLAAVIVMALATVDLTDPTGSDRRRYLALLLDGMRPGHGPLPTRPVGRPPVGGHATGGHATGAGDCVAAVAED